MDRFLSRALFFLNQFLTLMCLYLFQFEGDSGGALYTQTKLKDDDIVIASGIVSYGFGCALPGIPS
jgi:hypothetical protein